MVDRIQISRHERDDEDVSASPLEKRVTFWGCIRGDGTGKGVVSMYAMRE